MERPLQGLLFDVTGEHGQARRLDLAVVQEEVQSFGHAAPASPTVSPCGRAMQLVCPCHLISPVYPHRPLCSQGASTMCIQGSMVWAP